MRTDVIGKKNTDSNFDFNYQFAMYKVLDNIKHTTKGKSGITQQMEIKHVVSNN